MKQPIAACRNRVTLDENLQALTVTLELMPSPKDENWKQSTWNFTLAIPGKRNMLLSNQAYFERINSDDPSQKNLLQALTVALELMSSPKDGNS
jgi:hypothetical protein